MLSSAHRSSREIIVIQGKSRSFAKDVEIKNSKIHNDKNIFESFFIFNKNW
jgi:hypothetical protein